MTIAENIEKYGLLKYQLVFLYKKTNNYTLFNRIDMI